MQDPKWIGAIPNDPMWSLDGQTVYFDWNPDRVAADSMFGYNLKRQDVGKISPLQRVAIPARNGAYSKNRQWYLYEKYGDIFLYDLKKSELSQITATIARETSPKFSKSEQFVFYRQAENLFRWDRTTGETRQLSNIRTGRDPKKSSSHTPDQRAWLTQEELALMEVLNQRKQAAEARQEQRQLTEPYQPKPFYLGNQNLVDISSDPTGGILMWTVEQEPKGKHQTMVPDFVRESGYTEPRNARPKVGSPESVYETWLYSVASDTILQLDPSGLPGIYTRPQFQADYGLQGKLDSPKPVWILRPQWSPDGAHAVVVVRSLDFKDRWIASVDLESGKLKSLDHQHDEAWIGGPGISRWMGSSGSVGWMPDGRRFWFLSEESGYAHLYAVNVETGGTQAFTTGEFEVFDPQISKDGKYWYYSSSAVHPGERHFYKMPIEGGVPTQLTSMSGNNEVLLSPDEKQLLIRFSTGNRPWELFLQPNKPQAEAEQITHSLTDEWKQYPWREPEYVEVPAADGAKIYGRLYRSEKSQGGPAVIFVHGAGYLQNAHKWWSVYFREYMFHNLLVDRGYTVLDLDFRGSAGYGREWRAGVYRSMGGKDLDDQVDGYRYLVQEIGVDPNRVGIYGGSYGGFITLMAMFTKPGTFQAGAALRSVTDWAHYNHPYTASMLNRPQDDSLAYVKSSPIYFAEGLEGALLMCHGMVDTNVQFQDIVRLSQRLIELGKENWELAVYPMEGHGFVEPSSWTDEYRRILKLFEDHLK
ncbi:prolyl oligopeptidase family serine peptidase [Pontibacter sp. G13]|uniref:S9 family peptidase n=1 Tax=Pontibacter sp. G13 TaxID=3074898 RepID=UPI00288A7C6E|nr:prolyl oligopeptidase family serine peptidase [Pontibacter sp. G13]WNJ16197.1 prolyl oligopeptidase family serine peptidase [Pontibacter sp. G13]